MLDISLTISLEKMCNKTTWKLCNAWQTQYLFTPPSCLVFPLPCNPGTFSSLARALISGTKSPPHQILPFRFLRGHLPVNVAQCFGKNSYQVSEYWRTQIRLQRQWWLVFSWKKFQLSYFSLNLKEPGSLFLFFFFPTCRGVQWMRNVHFSPGAFWLRPNWNSPWLWVNSQYFIPAKFWRLWFSSRIGWRPCSTWPGTTWQMDLFFRKLSICFLKNLVVGVGGGDEFKGTYVNFKGTEWDASESVF